MDHKSGSQSLESEMQYDEQELSRLREEEMEVLEHIARGGFSAATKRETLLDQMREIEERLAKRRKRVATFVR